MVYFFIGIKGKGMRALAKFLVQSGNIVEGYDDDTTKHYPELNELGIKIHSKLDTKILQGKHIIVTSAISIDDLKQRFKIESIQYYNEFIGSLTRKIPTISVSGSFGKTTTTCFLAQILDTIKGCSYIVGDGTGHYNRDSEYFVLESCEFKRNFLSYMPQDLIITNIGLEHMDCYRDFNDILITFSIFCNNCSGIKVIYGDMKNVDYKIFNGNIIFYGFSPKNDVIIKKISYSDCGTKILINYVEKNLLLNIPLMLGKHQVLDLVAAIIMANMKGCPLDNIIGMLHNIHLPNYRFVKKKINGIPVISDIAAHYEGILNTINQIRLAYPKHKIHVIFEPVSYVRTMTTCDLICKSLAKADSVYICDIIPLREKNPEQYNFSVHDLIAKVKNAKYYSGTEKLYFDNNSVVAILANANIDTLEKNIHSLNS